MYTVGFLVRHNKVLEKFYMLLLYKNYDLIATNATNYFKIKIMHHASHYWSRVKTIALSRLL